MLPLFVIAGSGGWAQVTLTPKPTSIGFVYQTGGVLPAPKTVTVKASTGTPAYTTSITGTNILWLTASPDSGNMPAAVSLRANPTSLAEGTYSATLLVTVAGSAPASVSVTLVVLPALPVLVLSSNALSFAAPPGIPLTQTVVLTTEGGPIPFTTSVAGAAWLTASPASGVVLPGAPVVVTASVNATNLAPSATPYVGKITIVATGVPAANKTQLITVTTTVSSPVPTLISIWPSGAQTNSAAATITVRGTNFYKVSVVKAGATALATTLISASALQAVIPATMLTTAQTLNVLVSNPAPGGDSGTAPFTVANSPVLQAAVSVASYNGATISPGELIALFGINVGPVSPATMASTISPGFVDTTLSAVTVSVDGEAAPIVYASQNQVSVQVPYEVTIGANKVISVTNGANPAATVNVTIAATAPGLFTFDGSGGGQAAALNYNAVTTALTLNSANNAAKRGDTVVLYLTGEGDYAVSINPRTGYIIPLALNPLPQMATLPAVTIGGAAATVTYAGPIIASILGVLQINCVVPAGSTVGAAVPVLVTIGGNSTQANVTLSIK